MTTQAQMHALLELIRARKAVKHATYDLQQAMGERTGAAARCAVAMADTLERHYLDWRDIDETELREVLDACHAKGNK